MTDVVAARALTAISLAFHIIFSSIGIALPLLMVIAEGQWLRTKNQVYTNYVWSWCKLGRGRAQPAPTNNTPSP